MSTLNDNDLEKTAKASHDLAEALSGGKQSEEMAAAALKRERAKYISDLGEGAQKLLATKDARIKELESVMREMDSLVQFAAKREMESPSNGQDYAEEARSKLGRWNKTLAGADMWSWPRG